VPWPERILSVAVLSPGCAINVHTTHIPPGCTNGWKKVEMLEAVSAVVSEHSNAPSILCGDFNVPQAETPDGRIVTWGEDVVDGEPRIWGRWKGGEGRDWDRAERTVMEGGAQRHLIDAYRHLHGYGRQEFSWFVKRKEKRIGRRFDHVFCSRDLVIKGCEYLHGVREDGFSDHSALELDFEFGT
jgi:exonuclease III